MLSTQVFLVQASTTLIAFDYNFRHSWCCCMISQQKEHIHTGTEFSIRVMTFSEVVHSCSITYTVKIMFAEARGGCSRIPILITNAIGSYDSAIQPPFINVQVGFLTSISHQDSWQEINRNISLAAPTDDSTQVYDVMMPRYDLRLGPSANMHAYKGGGGEQVAEIIAVIPQDTCLDVMLLKSNNSVSDVLIWAWRFLENEMSTCRDGHHQTQFCGAYWSRLINHEMIIWCVRTRYKTVAVVIAARAAWHCSACT